MLHDVFLIPRRIVLRCIRLYQKFLSPDHSFWAKHIHPIGYCKFTPTCSEYGYMSIERYGVVRGGLRAAWRVLRCNPWSRGGEDLS